MMESAHREYMSNYGHKANPEHYTPSVSSFLGR